MTKIINFLKNLKLMQVVLGGGAAIIGGIWLMLIRSEKKRKKVQVELQKAKKEIKHNEIDNNVSISDIGDLIDDDNSESK